MNADLAGFKVNLLIDSLHHADFEIDDAVIAERGNHLTRFGVQFHQPVTGRDIEDRSSPRPSVQ